jgi:hypothetical protein
MTRSVLIFVTLHAVGALAQAPDFSGTWKLDPDRSRVAAEAGFAGLIPSGAPDRLHITQPANGTLIIESEINEGHARLYRPGGKSSTPAGQGGTITMTSRWEGARLVSEGSQETLSGQSTMTKNVKEVLALGADGRTLTIEVTTAGTGEKSVTTLTYTRTQVVEPCQKWPTPCKVPGQK